MLLLRQLHSVKFLFHGEFSLGMYLVLRCAVDFPGFFPGLGNRLRKTDALTGFGNQWRAEKVWIYFVFQSVLDREVLPVFSKRSAVQL